MRTLKYISILIIAFVVLSPGCKKNKLAGMKEYNLVEYGLPITIMAPENIKVESKDRRVLNDVTIMGGDNFSLQIYASDAVQSNLAKLKEAQLNEVINNPFFKQILTEEDNGFLYELAIDSTTTTCGFRYFYVMGDREYVFQPGLAGKFSHEDVELMYKAVQKK
jgi:hypothetical protein